MVFPQPSGPSKVIRKLKPCSPCPSGDVELEAVRSAYHWHYTGKGRRVQARRSAQSDKGLMPAGAGSYCVTVSLYAWIYSVTVYSGALSTEVGMRKGHIGRCLVVLGVRRSHQGMLTPLERRGCQHSPDIGPVVVGQRGPLSRLTMTGLQVRIGQAHRKRAGAGYVDMWGCADSPDPPESTGTGPRMR